MFQWDDITDDGPTTLVGGAIAFDHLAMFMTITICIGVLLVSLLSATTTSAATPTTVRRSTRCTWWPPSVAW